MEDLDGDIAAARPDWEVVKQPVIAVADGIPRQVSGAYAVVRKVQFRLPRAGRCVGEHRNIDSRRALGGDFAVQHPEPGGLVVSPA